MVPGILQSSPPAARGFAVVPSDAADLAEQSRYIWVGGAGAIHVLMAQQRTDLTISGIPAGTWLPIQVVKVFTTGTTATNIVALI